MFLPAALWHIGVQSVGKTSHVPLQVRWLQAGAPGAELLAHLPHPCPLCNLGLLCPSPLRPHSWDSPIGERGGAAVDFMSFCFCFVSFFFLIFYLLFIYYFYFWLCWVFVSVWGLSPFAASGGHSSSRCADLSLSRPLLLRSRGSRRWGSVVVTHGPSCSAACGILSDQGSNPCPLHWQADSQPLRHQGSPCFVSF